MKVLIVDDEAKVCNLVRKLIDWDGLGLELAGILHDGALALRFIQEHQPEIVITDIRMPGCSGIEMISQIRQWNLNTHFVIISGYRQFEYATHALRYGVDDYLLKPLKQKDIDRVLRKILRDTAMREADQAEKENLVQSVGLERGRLRERFLSDMLAGRVKPGELTLELLESRYGCTFREGGFLLVEVQNLSLRRPEEQAGQALMNSKIKTIMESVLGEVFADTVAVIQGDRVACAVFGTPEQFVGLHKSLRRIASDILALEDIFEEPKFIVAASLPALGATELPQCVTQVERALSQRLLLSPNATVQYAPEQEPVFAVEQLIHFKVRNDLRLAVSTLDAAQLEQVIGGVRTVLQNGPRLTGWDVRCAYLELVRLFLAATLDCGMKPSAGLEAELEADYLRARTVAELFSRLSERLTNAMADWQIGKNAEETRPIRLARKYIHENYAQPLTLQMLSEQVSLNATYFSSAFRRETGQTFLDYVTQVRIDAAKELLADTDLGIADIAERVGYQDMKYFYKRFRKFAGIGPKEYRRLYG